MEEPIAVGVVWEPVCWSWLRWPLLSPQGLTGAFPPIAVALPAMTLGLGTGTVQRIKEMGAAQSRTPWRHSLRRRRDKGQPVQHEDSRMKPAAAPPTQEALAGL